MAQLPIFSAEDPPTAKDFSLMQTRWKAVIDPFLRLPTNNGVLLKNVDLIAGVNVINHRLGKVQQGWILTDVDGAAVIYRSDKFNDKTLTLVSDAEVTVSLECY